MSALRIGDRVRILAENGVNVPRSAVGRTATVTGIDREGGVYVQQDYDKLERHYVPPSRVAACLEVIAP